MNRALLIAFVLTSASAFGQTGFPMIGCALPVGVERGKTTEVKVSLHAGNSGSPGNLHSAYKVLFHGEGMSAEIVPPEKGWPAPDPKKPDELPAVREATMRVTVATTAEPGIREFRIVTPRQGVSTVGYLVISEETDVLEKEPNNSAAEAQSVSIPGSVSGRIQQGEDADTFRFKAEAGQQIVFSVFCSRMQEKIHDLEERADLRLVLRDTAGIQLAANDDYNRADPLVHHKFEKAGEYLLQVRDTRYKGSAAWAYRLSMSSAPYLTAVFPSVVRPGETAELRLLGFNLSAESARLQVPADVQAGEWITRIPLGAGLSNPVRLLVSDLPESLNPPPMTGEGKPAGTTPTNLPLPGGVSSWLPDSRDVHVYKLKAKKGESWGFEIAARRLGSEIDSEIRLKHPNGGVLASNDDSLGKDSRIEWTAGEDGEYTLEVRGVDNSQGRGCFYNLSARSLRPNFRLRCDMDRAAIAPGNRTTWYVLVERRHGFGGPIKVEVTGLPAGVQVLPLTIPPELSVGTLILEAAADAKIDASLVKVIGSGDVPGSEGKPESVRRDARPLGEVYVPGGGRNMPEVGTQAVSVTQPNDLEVSVEPQSITLTPGGTARIDVTLRRRPGYNKPVTLDISIQHLGTVYANPLPPGVSVDDGASKTLLGEGETKGHLTFRAAGNAKPIDGLRIAVMANSSVNFVMKTWYASPPISLSVKPAAN